MNPFEYEKITTDVLFFETKFMEDLLCTWFGYYNGCRMMETFEKYDSDPEGLVKDHPCYYDASPEESIDISSIDPEVVYNITLLNKFPNSATLIQNLIRYASKSISGYNMDFEPLYFKKYCDGCAGLVMNQLACMKGCQADNDYEDESIF